MIGGGPYNVTVIDADVLDVGPELVNIPPGYDPDDPEATGPILPINMTQRMPRVPLPVLSDEEAAERAEEMPPTTASRTRALNSGEPTSALYGFGGAAFGGVVAVGGSGLSSFTTVAVFTAGGGPPGWPGSGPIGLGPFGPG